jgi:hypothetical protein
MRNSKLFSQRSEFLLFRMLSLLMTSPQQILDTLSYLPYPQERLESFVVPPENQHHASRSTTSSSSNSTLFSNRRYTAGAVLFSELSSFGWKFPTFTFSETDERYLFDVEVRSTTRHAILFSSSL